MVAKIVLVIVVLLVTFSSVCSFLGHVSRFSFNQASISRSATHSVARSAMKMTSTSTNKEEVVAEALDLLKQLVASGDLEVDGAGTDGIEKNYRDKSHLSNGVVRIYCTHSPPNFGMPWQRQRQEFSTSTGFVLDGGLIVTNAHAVEYGSLIQVKAGESEKKFVASAVAVGHECDLAILDVADSKFWEVVEPLTLGKIPELLEDVSVVGYPVGGDSLSITSGVVSRIEMQEYAQASAQLLAIQIDAAINPGNSGGPVVDENDNVIGVAFQSLADEDIENIGYVVPVNVINHFLEDVKRHGRYTGVCGLGVRLQALENEAIRRQKGMKEEDTGVLVISLADTAPAKKVLEVGDVLLSVDGTRISNDGKIPFRGGYFNEKVGMHYHFTQRFPDDAVELEILRAGAKQTVKAQLWATERLVPRVLTSKNIIDRATNQGTGLDGSIVGGSPSYLMIGGMVLISLGLEYLHTEFETDHMGDYEQWGDEFKLLALAQESKTEGVEEVVLLSQVISHSCNIGYETYRNLHLERFNGEQVRSMQHLKILVDEVENRVKLEEEDKDAFLTLEFANGQVIVLDERAAVGAQEQIASEHFIQSFCSEDLR